jgi:adenosylcobinamide kinase/adenosylcobinamide-phosphate guanylyltransferase
VARRFRDLAGLVNQKIAAACRQVVWMVAGIPVTIKPRIVPADH